MARLPTELTARLWFDYVTAPNGREHTFMIRPPAVDGAGRAEAQEAVRLWLVAHGTNWFRTGWRIIRVRYAPAGQAFSLPATLASGLGSFVGANSAAWATSREAVETRYVGRSPSTGRRLALSLYGVKSTLSVEGFRLEAGAAGDGLTIANVVGLMNTSANEVFGAVDGSVGIWYNYVNIQYNSYWERRIRIDG